MDNANEFERRMEEILQRNRVKNAAFAAEVLNLHKSLW